MKADTGASSSRFERVSQKKTVLVRKTLMKEPCVVESAVVCRPC